MIGIGIGMHLREHLIDAIDITKTSVSLPSDKDESQVHGSVGRMRWLGPSALPLKLKRLVAWSPYGRQQL